MRRDKQIMVDATDDNSLWTETGHYDKTMFCRCPVNLNVTCKILKKNNKYIFKHILTTVFIVIALYLQIFVQIFSCVKCEWKYIWYVVFVHLIFCKTVKKSKYMILKNFVNQHCLTTFPLLVENKDCQISNFWNS